MSVQQIQDHGVLEEAQIKLDLKLLDQGLGSSAALILEVIQEQRQQVKQKVSDGSSWTELNDLGTARRYIAGCGTYTAALCTGGSPSPAINEQWDGTSWTEVGDLNTEEEIAVK